MIFTFSACINNKQQYCIYLVTLTEFRYWKNQLKDHININQIGGSDYWVQVLINSVKHLHVVLIILWHIYQLSVHCTTRELKIFKLRVICPWMSIKMIKFYVDITQSILNSRICYISLSQSGLNDSYCTFCFH